MPLSMTRLGADMTLICVYIFLLEWFETGIYLFVHQPECEPIISRRSKIFTFYRPRVYSQPDSSVPYA